MNVILQFFWIVLFTVLGDIMGTIIPVNVPGAVYGLILGTLLVSVTAIFTNLCIIIPFYGTMLGLQFSSIFEDSLVLTLNNEGSEI